MKCCPLILVLTIHIRWLKFQRRLQFLHVARIGGSTNIPRRDAAFGRFQILFFDDTMLTGVSKYRSCLLSKGLFFFFDGIHFLGLLCCLIEGCQEICHVHIVHRLGKFGFGFIRSCINGTIRPNFSRFWNDRLDRFLTIERIVLVRHFLGMFCLFDWLSTAERILVLHGLLLDWLTTGKRIIITIIESRLLDRLSPSKWIVHIFLGPFRCLLFDRLSSTERTVFFVAIVIVFLFFVVIRRFILFL
mmetsp:Transcript_4120/g.11892  ORF Transcript_4120/g.11892 Transcript_4120/m.11892 type:complete len:245 (+) Transcript_4120:491-1225(+)